MSSEPGRQVVTLDIAASVTVDVTDPGRPVLVLQDWAVQVRIPIPVDDEYPYLHVKSLAQRIELVAAEVRRAGLDSWQHGPLTGPVGWKQ